MFRLTEPSPGQNTKHSTGTFSECTHYGMWKILRTWPFI